MGALIRNSICVVEEIDLDKVEIEWGEYMRIRVKINITKPIPRKKKLNLGFLEPVWVTISYERLSNFCYVCRLMGAWTKRL